MSAWGLVLLMSGRHPHVPKARIKRMQKPNPFLRLALAASVIALALPLGQAQAAPLAQDNLLPNPGFESGTGSWQAWWAEIAKPSIGYDYAFKPNSFRPSNRTRSTPRASQAVLLEIS